MVTYIVIDANGYVKGYSVLKGPVTNPHLIEVTDVSVAEGKMWNGTTWVADDRPPPTPEAYISTDDFIERFTDAEIESLISLSKTNAKAELFLNKLKMLSRVDLLNNRLITIVNQMETAGVIGTGRANEILSTS